MADPKPAPQVQPQVLPAETAAKLIMITPRHLRRLSADGWIPKPYTVPGVVQGYIRFRDDADKRKTMQATQSRANEARAAQMEFKLAAEQRHFVRTEIAAGMVQDVFGPLRSELEGLPAAFTRDLAERKRLEEMIGRAINAAADRARETAAALRSDGGNISPAAIGVARRLGKTKQDAPFPRGRPRKTRPQPNALHHPA
jgi:hypothetical protein